MRDGIILITVACDPYRLPNFGSWGGAGAGVAMRPGSGSSRAGIVFEPEPEY